MTYIVSEETKEEQNEPVTPCSQTLATNLQRYAERNSSGALQAIARRSHHAGYGNFEKDGEAL